MFLTGVRPRPLALVLLGACLIMGGIGLRAVGAQHSHAHKGTVGALSHGDAFARALAAGMEKMHKDMMTPAPTGNPDVDFLATMIPHHAGAVEMARLVLIHGRDPPGSAPRRGDHCGAAGRDRGNAGAVEDTAAGRRS